MNDDLELLHAYAERRSEPAFETLVSRHVDLVYSAALRQARQPHLAEEITQTVFIILARKAGLISSKTILPGWLYRTTRYAAAAALKMQRRREQREQEALMESLIQESPGAPDWEQLSPLLDDAMAQLRDQDRDALVLRYFQNKNLRDVGAALGVDEYAAQKRVSRALEKLHRYFSKRGISSTSAIIAGGISINSVHAAPVGLAKTISALAVAKGAAASTSTLTLIKGALKIMAWTKAKTAIVAGAGLLLAAGTTTIAVKEIHGHHPYPWQVRSFDSRVLDKVQPQVTLVPTIFPDSESWGSANGKFLGSGASIRDIVRTTYDKSLARTVLSTELPPGKYDYIANLPRGSAEALQKEIQRKFGVVGRREMRETDVLLLTVKSRNALGLRPSTTRRNSSLSNEGNHFSCINLPLTGLVDYLEYYLEIPVVDQTSLTSRFDIDLKLNEQDWQQRNPDALKQVLLDQLGLELVPTNMPIEMLMVEKAK